MQQTINMTQQHKLKMVLLFLLLPLLACTLYGQQIDGSTHKKRPIDSVSRGGPRLISRQFSFTEGPAVDRHGNVYFTDQPNNKIWKYGTDGRLSVFMDTAGRSNGMYFDRKGNLITCADEHDQLWSVSPDRKVHVLVKDFHGARLNGPNDVWVSPKGGGIYFTDPYYQRDYWKRTSPDPGIKGEYVYYLPLHDSVPVAVVEDLVKPNGIIGSPDGKWLFVADIKANKIWKYRIVGDGTLADKRLFANQGADGMTIDRKGDIYLCGNGVTVYNPAGVKIQHIPIPEPWTANICFGGRHRDQLFITASTAVYIVPMRVKGVKR